MTGDGCQDAKVVFQLVCTAIDVVACDGTCRGSQACAFVPDCACSAPAGTMPDPTFGKQLDGDHGAAVENMPRYSAISFEELNAASSKVDFQLEFGGFDPLINACFNT